MILADTHIAIWATLHPVSLSPAAGDALRTARARQEGVAISSLTLWEAAMLITKGRVKCPFTMSRYLSSLEKVFVILPLSAQVAERSMQFSRNYPADPADRIIGATALVHGISLVTADRPVIKSGEVPCIW